MGDVPHTSSVVCPYTGVKMGDVPHTSSVVCPYTGVKMGDVPHTSCCVPLYWGNPYYSVNDNWPQTPVSAMQRRGSRSP